MSRIDPQTERRLKAISERREWLNKNRGAYNEMKKRLDSPKAMRRMLLNLKRACGSILEYNPLNEPHVAVYIVADAKVNLTGFFEDLDFVEIYEEKLAELKELSRQVEPEEVGEQEIADPDHSD